MARVCLEYGKMFIQNQSYSKRLKREAKELLPNNQVTLGSKLPQTSTMALCICVRFLNKKHFTEKLVLFPEFDTSRLRLSSLKESDAGSIYELFSNQSVVEFYDLEAFSEPAQALNLINFFQSRFDEGIGIRWAIRLKGQLIGTCGFNSWNPKMKNAVIGYDLKPNYWGNGYAVEAIRRIIMAAFSGELPCGELNRIQGDTVPGNDASESVLRKVGFKEEGLRRQSGYWKGQFHDLKCFGLIKSEFIAI